MQIQLVPSQRIEVPRYAWLAVVLALFTALGAIPVGIMLITDPTGGSVGFPRGWIEATAFGSYTIPGIYLFVMNGLGMLLVAGLTLRRHWAASWLMGILGVGLVVWIAVQLVVMPETSYLQLAFGAIGVALSLTSLFWLRRTSQLRLW